MQILLWVYLVENYLSITKNATGRTSKKNTGKEQMHYGSVQCFKANDTKQEGPRSGTDRRIY
jgi:hypothetical protein